MNVEGANLDGIIKAIDFLINVNNGYRVELGEKVFHPPVRFQLSPNQAVLAQVRRNLSHHRKILNHGRDSETPT